MAPFLEIVITSKKGSYVTILQIKREENVIVEEAKTGDVEYLVDLLSLLFSKEAEFVPNRLLQTQGITRILENKQVGKIFVLREEKRVIGMVSLLWSISTALGGSVALLEDMVIDPAFQKKDLEVT